MPRRRPKRVGDLLIPAQREEWKNGRTRKGEEGAKDRIVPCRREYVDDMAIGRLFDQPSPRIPAELRAGKAVVGAVDWRATRVPEPLHVLLWPAGAVEVEVEVEVSD